LPRRKREETGTEVAVDLRRVERLADLARLSLGPGEAERLQGELSSILGYFAALERIELPSSLGDEAGARGKLEGVSEEKNEEGSTREDIVAPSTPEPILEGVPQRKGRYVRAPRVF
jgi:Asp-tRNA(Asn)/Glu-tRNA(Gln) amidotransferase C subunit